VPSVLDTPGDARLITLSILHHQPPTPAPASVCLASLRPRLNRLLKGRPGQRRSPLKTPVSVQPMAAITTQLTGLLVEGGATEPDNEPVPLRADTPRYAIPRDFVLTQARTKQTYRGNARVRARGGQPGERCIRYPPSAEASVLTLHHQWMTNMEAVALRAMGPGTTPLGVMALQAIDLGVMVLGIPVLRMMGNPHMRKWSTRSSRPSTIVNHPILPISPLSILPTAPSPQLYPLTK
jgi:hypothetical protein